MLTLQLSCPMLWSLLRSFCVLMTLQRAEADVMAVDGGQVYTAGKCGLVPVMVEQYNDGLRPST